MMDPTPLEDDASRTAAQAQTRQHWVRSSEYTSDDWSAVADMVEQAQARGLLRSGDPS